MAKDTAKTLPDEAAPSSGNYPLSWQRGDDKTTVEEFTKMYKPSKQSDTLELPGGIWVHTPRDSVSLKTSESAGVMMEKGEAIVDALSEECRRVAEDDAIPVRASKKNPENKKLLRERAWEKAKDDIKDLALECHCTMGKWLFYGDEDKIDEMWTKIAVALGNTDGALAQKTKVVTAKVATEGKASASKDGTTKTTYVICAYIENSWDQDAAYEACKVFIKDLHLTPNSFKADIYTYLGVDSSHPSGIKSTLYATNDVMSKKERDEFFESVSKKAVTKVLSAKEELEAIKSKGEGDGFDDSESEEEERPKKKKGKK